MDHTADLGLRITAPDLETLLSEAGRALASLFVEDLETIVPSIEVEIEISGQDKAYLLFDWLNELLFLFDTKQLLLSRFQFSCTREGVRALARGESLDRERHCPRYEIKAITYHGLKLEKTSDGLVAEVIVDL